MEAQREEPKDQTESEGGIGNGPQHRLFLEAHLTSPGWEADGERDRGGVDLCVHMRESVCAPVCAPGGFVRVRALQGLLGPPSWHLRNHSRYLPSSTLAGLSGRLQLCFSEFLVSVCLSQSLWLPISSLLGCCLCSIPLSLSHSL